MTAIPIIPSRGWMRHPIDYWNDMRDEIMRRYLLPSCLCRNKIIPDPRWLTWNDGTVVKLAKEILLNKYWSTMPILADALEQAGCMNGEILEHCRQSGPHVRGCWVLETLL